MFAIELQNQCFLIGGNVAVLDNLPYEAPENGSDREFQTKCLPNEVTRLKILGDLFDYAGSKDCLSIPRTPGNTEYTFRTLKPLNSLFFIEEVVMTSCGSLVKHLCTLRSKNGRIQPHFDVLKLPRLVRTNTDPTFIHTDFIGEFLL